MKRTLTAGLAMLVAVGLMAGAAAASSAWTLDGTATIAVGGPEGDERRAVEIGTREAGTAGALDRDLGASSPTASTAAWRSGTSSRRATAAAARRG